MKEVSRWEVIEHPQFAGNPNATISWPVDADAIPIMHDGQYINAYVHHRRDGQFEVVDCSEVGADRVIQGTLVAGPYDVVEAAHVAYRLTYF